MAPGGRLLEDTVGVIVRFEQGFDPLAEFETVTGFIEEKATFFRQQEQGGIEDRLFPLELVTHVADKFFTI